MDAPSWAVTIGWMAGSLLSLGVIYRYVWPALKGVYRIAKAVDKGATDYQRTGGFGGLSADLEAVKKQLQTNGGSSLRDAVDGSAREARAAVVEAQRIGEIVEELRGHARANQESIADLRDQVNDVSQRATAVAETQAALQQADQQYAHELQSYLDGERRDLLRAREGLLFSVAELLQVEREEGGSNELN